MKKFLLVLIITGILNAGWIIKFKEEAEGEKPETTTCYISKGVMVFESKEDVVLLDYKNEIIRMIDHEEKSYIETTVDEFINMYSGMKKIMEEMMEEMPPQQREMMEKMMKPKININKTSKTEKILGYNTFVYEIIMETYTPMGSIKTKSEEYISPDLDFLSSEISKEDAEKISKKFEKMMTEFSFFNMIGRIEKGWVLKWIYYGEGNKITNKGEAISINKGEIPSSLLKIPKGYKKKEILEEEE